MAASSVLPALGTGALAPSPRRALSWSGGSLSYAQLADQVERVAGRLSDTGIQPGERVAIVSGNTPALVVALLAVWRRGAVAVPVSARLRGYDLGAVLGDARVSAVLTVAVHQGYSFVELLTELLPTLPTVRHCLVLTGRGEVTDDLPGQGVPAERSGDGIGLLLYTSGTEGTPKGVLTRLDATLEGARIMGELLELTSDDTTAMVIPLTHAFGLGCLLAALLDDSHAVLVDAAFSLEPLLAAADDNRATVLHGAPSLFNALVKAGGLQRRTFRRGFVAGASCPPPLLERLDAEGMKVLNLYGMTELGAASCALPSDSPVVRYTTVGRPVGGYAVRTDPGTGEVQFKGDRLSPGYWKQPGALALVDGWFRTGDLGSVDEHGNLTITGRLKEMVNVAGFTVAPSEVEGLLLTHPNVLQAVVVPVHDETRGDVLHAFVVTRRGATVSPIDLLRYARSRVAGYKLPYRIELLDELPLLATGKPDRGALAEAATSGP